MANGANQPQNRLEGILANQASLPQSYQGQFAAAPSTTSQFGHVQQTAAAPETGLQEVATQALLLERLAQDPAISSILNGPGANVGLQVRQSSIPSLFGNNLQASTANVAAIFQLPSTPAARVDPGTSTAAYNLASPANNDESRKRPRTTVPVSNNLTTSLGSGGLANQHQIQAAQLQALLELSRLSAHNRP